MGAQIAQQAALHGLDVMLHDQSEEQLRRAAASNRGHVMRRVEKGKLTEADAESALDRVQMTSDLAEAVGEADFGIEVAFEELGLKRSIFAELGRLAPPRGAVARNSANRGIRKSTRPTALTARCVNLH